MKVALVPMRIRPLSPEENFHRFVSALRSAVEGGASLVVFPETTFTGYAYRREVLERFAEPVPGPLTDRISEVVRGFGAFVVVGTLEREGELFYDTALLFGPTGDILLHHRKIEEKPPFSTGYDVKSVRIPFGTVSVLICGDLFNDSVPLKLDGGTDLLAVPMARAFAGKNPDPERWLRHERWVYAERVKTMGRTSFLVNAFEEGGEFGGAMVVSEEGEILAESPHGSDEMLFYEHIRNKG